MPTAIEMYRRAYDLDYRKGDWRQAEALYRQIIEQYPYSDEKEYCLVHLERLEKIKLNPNGKKGRPVRQNAGQNNALGLFNFFLILILAFVVAACAYFVWKESRQRTCLSLVIQAAISEKYGDNDRAEEYCRLAQNIFPQETLPYRFLAEHYISSGQNDLAEAELRKWTAANPEDPDLKEFRARLSAAVESAQGGTP
jgi:tetratricopeptide (TPR) repeat protein